ncbi:hypothetical protein AGMMS50268_14950 [Spirochaetia bacterium]|nr:hypothetical protein AGMMS50268_14950 [Spirochaetia bacterium]
MRTREQKDWFVLKIHFFLFFIVFILAIFGTSIFISVQQVQEVAETVSLTLGIPIAKRAAALVDGDSFERLSRTLDSDDPFYESTRIKLLALKEETQCRYLYTMSRDSNGVHHFIIDGSAPPGEPGFSPLGVEENISGYDIFYLRTWETGLPQFGMLEHLTWGYLISAYAPIFNSRGEMIGIAGCDFDTGDMFRLIYRQMRRQLAFSGLLITAGIVIFLLLFRRISRLNQNLSALKTKAELAAESNALLLEERNKQNQSLLDLKNKADAASRAKSDFLAGMSHEIRTPMNAISGMSELLLRRELDDESRGYARDIKQAAANLLSIINDLLDFSKIEAGRLELVPIKYYLSSLCNDVVNIVRMRLMEKTIRFYTNIDAAIPNMLIGDEVRIRQIILNLLGNSVKYTEKGFISLTITREEMPSVSSASEKKNTVMLKISVADSGFGIKSEDQKKLFGEFVQVDTKKNLGIEGTGLGLAITKRLCVAMGGDITLESEYGKGSIFTVFIPQEIASDMPFALVDKPKEKKTLIYEGRMIYAKSVSWSLDNMGVPHRLVTTMEDFTSALRNEEWYFVFSGYGLYDRIKPVMDKIEREFPAKKQPPLALMIEWGTEAYIPNVRFVSLPIQSLSIADVLNGSPDRRNYGESAFTGTRFTTPDARLLVVDDIATNLKVADGLIAPYQAKVDTCLSGAEALELVKRNSYDLVFMDHMMPGMDGVEATGFIREWEEMQKAAKPIPIVALTANAVAGMREMFLAQGFNDFLAKPIDVSKLDDILAKWISPEKRIKAGGDIKRETFTGDAGITIPGVDVQKGISMTGGTLAGYRKVLSQFYKDAESRLPLFETAPSDPARQDFDLTTFATQAHAIKSASATIGAADVSKLAAELEAAGKAGDMAAITEKLPLFYKTLSELAGAIEKNLTADHTDLTQEEADEFKTKLKVLREMIQAENMKEYYKVLAEIEKMSLDTETREKISAIANHVLMGDYEEALEETDRIT